jgi:hypothetical protein
MFDKTISLFLIINACLFSQMVNGQMDSLSLSKSDALWVDATAQFLPVTTEWTNRAEVADINGDGWVDFIFANGGNYSEAGSLEAARVFLNQGPNKKFKEATDQVFGDQKFLSRAIKVRDINKDGIVDIIVGNTYQNQTHLYMGQGNGVFQDSTTTHLPQMDLSVGDLEFGDADGDGDLDLILADWGAGSNMNNNGGKVRLWLNDGEGHFEDVTDQKMPDILVQFSWDIEFFDFDNDFDLDIAISCKRCATSRIYVNDGVGQYTDKRLLPAYTNNYELEIMDVNQDGFLDLVTVNDGEIVDGDSGSRREHLFLNDKGERFIDATHELWPDSANIGKDDNNIVFLDYDSDGDGDFILSSLTGEDRLLVNDGKGKFSLRQSVLDGAPTPWTLALVLADINNDKKLDIVMGQGESDSGMDERVFLGNSIKEDSAPPIISHYKMAMRQNRLYVYARIHDNKSPSMPQDWKEVSIYLDNSDEAIPMKWFGEYLWTASFDASGEEEVKICAVDFAGNKTCLDIE